MNALSSPLSPLAAASPLPQAAASLNQSEDASGNGFSRCLDQAREPDHTKAREHPPAKTPASKDKVRSAREADAAPKAERAEPATPETAEADGDSRTADVESNEATAPDLAALLPGWTPTNATPSATAPVATAGDDDSKPQQDGAPIAGVTPLPPPRDGADAQALTRPAAATKAADAGEPAASGALTAPNEPRHVASPEAPTVQAPMPIAGATPIAAAPKTADALPTATVHAHLDSPAFSPTVATQVRWWAQDGVQQAQLMLNPAEMGPVTVQISLDGREARIDFRADMAATRSALEAALPVLAAALDDSGLRLTGGGVHDGSTQHQHAGHQRRPTQHTASGASTRDANALHGARGSGAARGLVDLVA